MFWLASTHNRTANRASLRTLQTTTRARLAPNLSPHHAIYVSNSTNPYFNLTLEDWLFRHKNHKEPLLLLYRDDPCVVIGRNQNPWKEVNLVEARRTGTPWIRRRSGGGTVYHDHGNTNFSIHLPRSSFDRNATAQVVLRAVRSLGIDADVNDRNDICVGKDKICSAYKIVNNRAYHHGTMLISTQLDTLGNLLRVNKDTMDTKGVASVRSPVRNLQQYNPDVTHTAFVNAIVDAFKEEYGINEEVQEVEETEEVKNIHYLRTGMAELPEWDWAFGQTPEFTYTIERSFAWGDVIHSKHGVILECLLECSSGERSTQQALKELGDALKKQRYAFVEESQLGVQGDTDSVKADVWTWLNEAMTT